jgi:hypothetical protein
MSDVTILGLCTDNLVTVLQPAPSVQCISCGCGPTALTTGTTGIYTAGTTNTYTLAPLCGPVAGYISIANAATGATTATLQLSVVPAAWASTLFVPANQPATTIAMPFYTLATGNSISVVVSDSNLSTGPYAVSVVASSISPSSACSSSCC